MEVAFFPSLLGSNLQIITLFPLSISPGIHYPDINEDWTRLALAILRSSQGPKPRIQPTQGLGCGLCWLATPALRQSFQGGRQPYTGSREPKCHALHLNPGAPNPFLKAQTLLLQASEVPSRQLLQPPAD